MSSAEQVWLVEDDAGMRLVLEQALADADISARSFTDLTAARDALQDAAPEVLVTDLMLPDGDGLDLLDALRDSHPTLPVIVITAHADMSNAVAALSRGAFEYLAKPFDLDRAIALVRHALDAAPEHAPASAADGAAGGAAREDRVLVGRSPAMQELFRAIGRLAGTAMPVLIQGESGTGKELVARALHQHSPRAGAAFVALNTAAIPSELLESELFGHERGAFTGAESRRIGRFEEADGGTLFLDEIGDMPLSLQTRMLRVLAEGEFHRVGGQRPLRVDVRIVAATHQDLEALVGGGRFREDLLHRLDVVRLAVPPLRERPEDVPELLDFYLEAAAAEAGVPRKRLHPQAELALCAAPWPGNVRQLMNLCRRLTALVAGREIRSADLPLELRRGDAGSPPWVGGLLGWAQGRWDRGESGLAQEALDRVESALMDAALERSRGHRQDAARLLGWGRNTLTRKLKDR